MQGLLAFFPVLIRKLRLSGSRAGLFSVLDQIYRDCFFAGEF